MSRPGTGKTLVHGSSVLEEASLLKKTHKSWLFISENNNTPSKCSYKPAAKKWGGKVFNCTLVHFSSKHEKTFALGFKIIVKSVH